MSVEHVGYYQCSNDDLEILKVYDNNLEAAWLHHPCQKKACDLTKKIVAFNSVHFRYRVSVGLW